MPCIEPERLSRGDGADRQRILKAFQFSDTKTITLTETYGLAGDDSLDGEFFVLERACEAYGTGIYDRQTYLERVQKVNASRAELQARVGESGKGIGESGERHGKAVPIPTRVVGEMHTLTPREQNDLLKMIIDRIEYEKTESGAAIGPTLRISLEI